MQYQVIISDKAYQLINQHLLFIGKVSKEAAIKQNKEFQEAIRKIACDPKMYQLFDNSYIPQGKYRKYIVSKRYIIIYQIRGNEVFIDYVIDTRTDYSWLIE